MGDVFVVRYAGLSEAEGGVARNRTTAPKSFRGCFCMVTQQDIYYMRRAMTLASLGAGWVNPNPLVGAVIVRDGEIIGEGWHRRCGELHAERNALASCRVSPQGATMYVTLEPCCHYGKTPPCTEALVEAGIARVVVGIGDPNPKVAGGGIEILRRAGIEVECGVLADELRYQNRVFLHYISTRLPWVTMKTATTLDGKIAAHTGDSRWITCEASRRRVHLMRTRHMAVLTGIGTVLADDPMLNCRLDDDCRQPIRIVADTSARLPLESHLVHTCGEERTIVAHTAAAPAERVAALNEAGVETWECPAYGSHVDLGALFERAGAEGIDSVMTESGGRFNSSLVEGGYVDEVAAFIAPKIIGGASSPSPVGGRGLDFMSQAMTLSDVRSERIDDDVLITGLVKKD